MSSFAEMIEQATALTDGRDAEAVVVGVARGAR